MKPCPIPSLQYNSSFVPLRPHRSGGQSVGIYRGVVLTYFLIGTPYFPPTLLLSIRYLKLTLNDIITHSFMVVKYLH